MTYIPLKICPGESELILPFFNDFLPHTVIHNHPTDFKAVLKVMHSLFNTALQSAGLRSPYVGYHFLLSLLSFSLLTSLLQSSFSPYFKIIQGHSQSTK